MILRSFIKKVFFLFVFAGAFLFAAENQLPIEIAHNPLNRPSDVVVSPTRIPVKNLPQMITAGLQNSEDLSDVLKGIKKAQEYGILSSFSIFVLNLHLLTSEGASIKLYPLYKDKKRDTVSLFFSLFLCLCSQDESPNDDFSDSLKKLTMVPSEFKVYMFTSSMAKMIPSKYMIIQEAIQFFIRGIHDPVLREKIVKKICSMHTKINVGSLAEIKECLKDLPISEITRVLDMVLKMDHLNFKSFLKFRENLFLLGGAQNDRDKKLAILEESFVHPEALWNRNTISFLKENGIASWEVLFHKHCLPDVENVDDMLNRGIF